MSSGLLYAQSEASRFIEVRYESGDKQEVHFGQFVSGAIIRNIVDRAKLLALTRTLAWGDLGVRRQDLHEAALAEMRSVADVS
ncbi:hypothetical protein ABT369_57710 [Dactylosporangium sp. NPDC000244]|uniref:hypothetical protein n=1 Tax=Dactylosporangium sp. NPDC000244 TaxID=3154365 RepID=UPI0033226C8C